MALFLRDCGYNPPFLLFSLAQIALFNLADQVLHAEWAYCPAFGSSLCSLDWLALFKVADQASHVEWTCCPRSSLSL